MKSINEYLDALFPRMEELHLKMFPAQAYKTLTPKFGAKVVSLDVHHLKDLDAVAESCPNLESLIITDPELGLKWDRVPLGSLRMFSFDDSSFFVNFDFIAQVTSVSCF